MMSRFPFWQAGWWKEKERISWAVTIGMAALLIAGGAYLDQLRNSQEAAEQAAVLTEGLSVTEQGAEQQTTSVLAESGDLSIDPERTEGEDPISGAMQSGTSGQQQAKEPGGSADGSANNLPMGRDSDAQIVGNRDEQQSQGEQQNRNMQEQPGYQEDGQPQPGDEPEVLTVSAGPLSFVMPVKGEVQRGHGYDYDPTTEDYRFHKGVDLAAEVGSAVLCAAPGQVTAAAHDAYWGGVVVVDHGGGWSSAYRGLDPDVEVGDQVEAGAILGYVRQNMPAESLQPSHVHVELMLEGDSLDPSLWL